MLQITLQILWCWFTITYTLYNVLIAWGLVPIFFCSHVCSALVCAINYMMDYEWNCIIFGFVHTVYFALDIYSALDNFIHIIIGYSKLASDFGCMYVAHVMLLINCDESFHRSATLLFQHCACLYIVVVCIWQVHAGAQFEAISTHVKTESVHYQYMMLTWLCWCGPGLCGSRLPDSVYRIQSQSV